MDNQHRKISGYRDLSEAEIDLMNRIKAKAAEVGALVEEIMGSRGSPEGKRCAAIAKTELQSGFMWLTRSVALPETF